MKAHNSKQAKLAPHLKASVAGQSTIEFALTLVLIMSFVFFYIQLSLVFAYGNYVHYATFMAARAYLSAGQNETDQEERATRVITSMLKKDDGITDKFSSIGQGVDQSGTAGQDGSAPPGMQVKPPADLYNATDPAFSWLQGVRYTFRSKLFLIPFDRGSPSKLADTVNAVTLTSESWLLREPTWVDCQTYLGNMNAAAFDNGC